MAPNPLASLPVIEPLTRPWSPSWKYYSNISKQFEEILLNNISDDLHKKVFFWAVSEKGGGGGTYQNFWYLMYLWSNSSEKLYKLPKFSEGRSSLAIKKMTEPLFFFSQPRSRILGSSDPFMEILLTKLPQKMSKQR